ncbi:MAG TPA: hypothetical protein VIK55_03015 [Paludibacter sp.]|nr:hypothetical protein [Prolixibacteraceae bacterium]
MIVIILVGIVMNLVLFYLIYRLNKWSKLNDPIIESIVIEGYGWENVTPYQNKIQISTNKSHMPPSQKPYIKVEMEAELQNLIFSRKGELRNTNCDYKDSKSIHNNTVHFSDDDALSFREKGEWNAHFKICQN